MAGNNPNVATPEMLNAIRAEASDAYQNAVPLATPTNLADVGNPILNYEAVGNEFVGALVNKIIYQLIDRKLWANPLAELRRGTMELGFDIEDVHTNPVSAQPYDGTQSGMAELLKMSPPDVASVYYRLNRQDKYPLTINNDQLRGAFTAWTKMESFIASLVDAIYNGATIDEYRYTKQLVSNGITAGRVITQTVTNPIDQTTGKQFMQALRSTSIFFTFPSTQYNAYKLAGGTAPARTTWAPIEDQIILIRGDVASNVGVEVLASLFNVNYADYLARQIIVDNFDDDKTLAVLADKRAFVIMEQLRQFRTFYNGASLNWNYWYHCWDLFALSPMRNMVAFQTA